MVDITNRGPIFGAISCRVPGIRTEWLPWNCLATAPAAWDLGWLVVQPGSRMDGGTSLAEMDDVEGVPPPF